MIDVIINVFGKPWQTICTLKSLLKHSGYLIDKIYLIEEKQQPYGEAVSFIRHYFDNLIWYTPNSYNFMPSVGNWENEEERWGVRYQYGIEHSDKKYVFITHNDVLYTEDIIGKMLEQVEGYVGIGHVGQCWNCPAYFAGLCNSDKFQDFKLSYEESVAIYNQYPAPRTKIKDIDKEHPTPFPECRLNEWACLIDRETTMKECIPNGNTQFFGSYYRMDVGCSYFKEMFIKGYKFKNYQQGYTHGYWAGIAGYPNSLNYNTYKLAEEKARKYFNENFTK